jgi:hypothetical protein
MIALGKLMLVKAFVIPFVILLLACSQTEVPPETEIIRIVTEVEVPVITVVIKEVPVVTKVPVEVIVEVPVALVGCPVASEIDWLIMGLEEARTMHQAWADYLLNNPPEEGSLLKQAVDSNTSQLAIVAMYDRRLSIVRQLQQVCVQ